LKKILIAAFWILFFGFSLYKLIPNHNYLSDDTLEHWGSTTTLDNCILALHTFAGIIVYYTSILQFTPAIRNRYISFHLNMGKLYVLSSLLCIITLYIMIPRADCIACRPSQFAVTSFWLLFIMLAYYFVQQRKIVLHKRMMISSFICAAYFVTIRVIDTFAIDVFYYLFPQEPMVFLASDLFVWVVPLVLFKVYWLIEEKNKQSLRTAR
jgi:hypothetical protein